MKHENLHVLLLTIKNKALHIRIGKINQLVLNDTLLNFENNIKKRIRLFCWREGGPKYCRIR